MHAAAPITLYRHLLSGHAHRAELFLSLLGLPYTAIDVDLLAGQQRGEDFLRLNPFGQVPVIDDSGVVVADSNAILVYLALQYGEPHWLPRDAAGMAQVQRWLSVAAGEVAFGPALARLGKLFGVAVNAEDTARRSARLFGLIEKTLATQAFLTGAQPTIADVACYSYIARAPEGGIALEPYPVLRAWLARIEALPRFVPMVETAPHSARAA